MEAENKQLRYEVEKLLREKFALMEKLAEMKKLSEEPPKKKTKY